MLELAPRFRGDTFELAFTLASPWIGTNFSEVRCTLRTELPSSDVVDDEDETVVYQATKTDGQITFDEDTDREGLVTIADDVTQGWPTQVLYWDIQVTYGTKTRTIASGTVRIMGDVTRTH